MSNFTSSVFRQVSVPKIKLNIGIRAFSVAAPTIWNQFSIIIILSETIATFRKKLKTYFFEIAFPPYISDGYNDDFSLFPFMILYVTPLSLFC